MSECPYCKTGISHAHYYEAYVRTEDIDECLRATHDESEPIVQILRWATPELIRQVEQQEGFIQWMGEPMEIDPHPMTTYRTVEGLRSWLNE